MKKTITISNVSSSAQRLEIARLLYEGDDRFVPVTPLATLETLTTFYCATMEDNPAIRAATSFDEWLVGCNDSAGRDRCTVYELASSIVRRPMGGFTSPSLQQIFVFVRLVAILYPYISVGARRGNDTISVVSVIAAQNTKSLAGMKHLGMVPVENLPKWLTYEHRSWFPKLEEGERKISDEAHYLWFPGNAVRKFMESVAPYADGSRPLERPSRMEKGATEQCYIKVDVPEFQDLRELCGPFPGALRKIPYEIFSSPPLLARLDGGVF